MKTDIEKLIGILVNQEQAGIDSNDWDSCRYFEIREGDEEVERMGDYVFVKLQTMKIEFAFSKETGRFRGIVNWKY